MAYAFEHDESVADGIRRIVGEQRELAVRALSETAADDPAEAIHECRRRCKQIRGAARLVRGALTHERYDRVNELARDAARELSALRDATATAATFEQLRALTAAAGDRVDPVVVEAVAGALAERYEAANTSVDTDHEAIRRAARLLDELGGVVDELRLERRGWKALAPGLTRTYRRGRLALRDAADAPTGSAFHELRKRAKYTRYHLELLTPAAPALVAPAADAFHHLTDALGDEHDLFVLRDRIGTDPVAGHDTAPVRDFVDDSRAELQRRAVGLARQLYAESPKRFAHRHGVLWRQWREHEAVGVAGGIDVVFG